MASAAYLANVLLALSDAIDLASPSISRHQVRTSYLAWELGKAAGLPRPLLGELFLASLFHDIGAITVEEKIALFDSEFDLHSRHCLRGELLMRRIPLLTPAAGVVASHHREWREWDRPIEDPTVLLSQILCLADHVDRFVDRDDFILHQSGAVSERIAALAGSAFEPGLAGIFRDLARREDMWLNLVNPRLDILLFREGPLRGARIGYEELESISDFLKDIIDLKSPFTATHSTGVTACADALSALSGASEAERRMIRIAGNFHDLGKLVIPNSIIDKDCGLTREEYQVVKSHTYYSYAVMDSIAGLHEAAQWGSYHHERLDGSGYPFHRAAGGLPIQARIIAVADLFTALAEDRPYRKGIPAGDVRLALDDLAGAGKIDAEIVGLLEDNYDEISGRALGAQAELRDFYYRNFAVGG
jgi:HD-GYP domain-containing protein (c-di-GMP phosphodiesterase class II)